MKKIFSFIIVLALLFFAFQIGITLFKKGHLVSYDIDFNNQKLKVTEEYIKTKNEDYYLFEITIGKKLFVFEENNNFNKQKKVINDIKVYEKDDLTCISPIYIKNNDDAQIVCNENNQQVSYTYVKDKYDLSRFVDTLNNFNKDKYDYSNSMVTLDMMSIYKDNTYEDEYLVVYDYKELIKISNKVREKIKFSNYDVYHNEMGVLIDKYYILPSFESKPEYSSMIVIDIISKEKETIKFDKKLSTNLYINGVVDNKLYFFDKSNFVQYEIDPHKKTYRVVGNRSTNAQYYDGKWSTRNIYDFFKEDIKFTNTYPIENNYIKAFETDKAYYYYNSNNEFYKVYKNSLDNPILLFEFDDTKEVNVINDCIYFIHEDTIYRYDETGTKPLVINNEFKHNYENIYGVYYK